MDKVGELRRGQVTRGLECQMVQRGKGYGPPRVLEFIPSSNTNLLSTYYVKTQTLWLYFHDTQGHDRGRCVRGRVASGEASAPVQTKEDQT